MSGPLLCVLVTIHGKRDVPAVFYFIGNGTPNSSYVTIICTVSSYITITYTCSSYIIKTITYANRLKYHSSTSTTGPYMSHSPLLVHTCHKFSKYKFIDRSSNKQVHKTHWEGGSCGCDAHGIECVYGELLDGCVHCG